MKSTFLCCLVVQVLGKRGTKHSDLYCFFLRMSGQDRVY